MDPEQFAEILRKLANEDGFKFPITVACVATNGSVLVIRYDEDGSAVVLAEHMKPEGFATPINCMYVDTNGEAARVTIRPENVVFN